MKGDNNIMIGMAKKLAADAINEAIDQMNSGLPAINREQGNIQAVDMYIVWFSKTLQNWKAIVSTNVKPNLTRAAGNYVEVTHNGDKGETYCDVYRKVLNRAY